VFARAHSPRRRRAASSTYPPEAERIAKHGDMVVNYEAVVALKPDLIVSHRDLAART
jgi:ABC-type Fe3+-hydroxamate transport system substrate-binding protein